MSKIRVLISVTACLAAASFAQGGETCSSCNGSGVRVNSADRTTSALMLGASTNNRIDVSALLAQRSNRVGVDDVRRPGFNGMSWNGNNPGAHHDASGDCYAAGYGAAGQENAVILVHAEPRVIMAINPFAPIEHYTADGQRMSPNVVNVLEHKRSQWLRDNGYTGGVRTFSNDRPQPKDKKDVNAIKPRAIIELNPEVPRLKSRMQVRVTPKAPAVVGVATTNATTTDTPAPAPKQPKKVEPSMKVAIATTNPSAPESR